MFMNWIINSIRLIWSLVLKRIKMYNPMVEFKKKINLLKSYWMALSYMHQVINWSEPIYIIISRELQLPCTKYKLIWAYIYFHVVNRVVMHLYCWMTPPISKGKRRLAPMSTHCEGLRWLIALNLNLKGNALELCHVQIF